jgi:hypothetical protein
VSKNHDGCVRSYIHTSAAWYGGANVLRDGVEDEVMIGMYDPDGGTTGEFAVRWYKLSGKLTPKLEAYDDAWSALLQFQDVLAMMAELDGEDPSPAEFCRILEDAGVKDTTERESPYDKPKTSVQDQLVDALNAARSQVRLMANGLGKSASSAADASATLTKIDAALAAAETK